MTEGKQYCYGCKHLTTSADAAGPDVPFGSIIWVDGVGWRIVQDRGSGIGGGYIDICMVTQEEALAWGRRNVRVVWQE